jgi:foldase protein PrsA
MTQTMPGGLVRAAALIGALLLLANVATGCSLRDGRSAVVATVNGEKITTAELNSRLHIYSLFFRQQMDDPATRLQLLDQLIRERLILQQAEAREITVEPARVDAELHKFFTALQRQYGDRAELDEAVSERSLTNDAIASFLADFLLAQAVLEQKRAEVDAELAELEEFYEANRETLYTFRTEVVRASHVLLPADQQETAAQIAAKVRAGGDFAVLAGEYSVDPGSARFGGELGYFTKETMVSEFAAAAFSLRPGEVSDPVLSPFGWHVIRVTDRKAAGTLTFDEALSDVRSRLLPQKQDAAVEQWVSDLEKRATITRKPIASEKPSDK